jgi:hypothetical protein
LQKLEDSALPVLRRLREQRFALSAEDRVTFAGYIALAFTRVPTFERSTDRLTALITAKRMEFIATNKQALESVVAELREHTGEEIDPLEFRTKLIGGTVEVKQANRGWSIRQMFELMLRLQKVIYSMNWVFLHAAEGDSEFLTSDNPVSLFNPLGQRVGAIGFSSSPAAYFTFPVSRHVCLLAQHQRGPEKAELNGSMVRSVNRGTIARADSQLYAPFKSASVQKILDSVVSQRTTLRKVLIRKGRVVLE